MTRALLNVVHVPKNVLKLFLGQPDIQANHESVLVISESSICIISKLHSLIPLPQWILQCVVGLNS